MIYLCCIFCQLNKMFWGNESIDVIKLKDIAASFAVRGGCVSSCIIHSFVRVLQHKTGTILLLGVLTTTSNIGNIYTVTSLCSQRS